MDNSLYFLIIQINHFLKSSKVIQRQFYTKLTKTYRLIILVEEDPYCQLLTLQAVGVQQILALLVALDRAFSALDTLPCDAPQQPLALVAISGMCCCPWDKIVRCCATDWINQCLQCFFIYMHFLKEEKETVWLCCVNNF